MVTMTRTAARHLFLLLLIASGIAAAVLAWPVDVPSLPLSVPAQPQSTAPPPRNLARTERESVDQVSAMLAVVDRQTSHPISAARVFAGGSGQRLLAAADADLTVDEHGRSPVPSALLGRPLLVTAPGYRSAELSVVVGKPVLAQLDRMQSVVIECRDEDGAPVADVNIAVSAQPIIGKPANTAAGYVTGAESPRSIYLASSDHGGQARLMIPSDGDYFVQAWSRIGGCTNGDLYVGPIALSFAQPTKLEFRRFLGFAFHGYGEEILGWTLSLDKQSRALIEKQAQHLAFDSEHVTVGLQAVTGGVHCCVLIPVRGVTSIPVTVTGILSGGRSFVASGDAILVDRVKQQPIVLGSREAGNLRVRVVDNEMADAQGVACRVRSHESGVSVATLSGVEVGLPEGTYSVTLEGSWIGKGAAGVSANLVGGDRAEAVLDLGGRKSVTLRIRAADVPTLGRVQLKWVMEGAASPLWTYNWNPHSDSLVWLPKGQHVLEVHCPGYKPSMVKIGLDDADHQRVLNISMAPDVK